MYEVVKRVNDTTIWRMEGTKGRYIIRLDSNRFLTFPTIKAAEKYIMEEM